MLESAYFLLHDVFVQLLVGTLVRKGFWIRLILGGVLWLAGSV
jgi:hypothetical protein